MRAILFLIMLVTTLGCATTRTPDYIKPGHPYLRKINGQYESIIDAIKVELFKENWRIKTQINPSVYERREGGEDQSEDVLFFTDFKKSFTTSEHLNIYVHAIAGGAEVEIRYESFGPMTQSVRHDKLGNHLLDNIEQELESK